jgi:uncharacterized repeat protein (TIGR03803 family)
MKLSSCRTIFFLCAFCAIAAIGSPAQTFTTLFSFDAGDGSNPINTPLVQGLDGNLYGTAFTGGFGEMDADLYCDSGCGTVFRKAPGGRLITLHNFCSLPSCADGAGPYAGLVLGTSRDLYGVTSLGGKFGGGTVFKITPTGELTTLHNFDGTDGADPQAWLVQATDGTFYGTTDEGGANGYGTVFKITPTGKLSTLHNFDGTDGAYPYSAGLMQATPDGNFYGTTYNGGANGYGTVFEITPTGELSTLHSFDGTDGANPTGGLIQATDGKIYGTTDQGGANGYGTVFKITPTGELATLHSFDGTDGADPYGGLVQGTDGNFYGTTSGTIFKITAEGELTTLYNFCSQPSCTDGDDATSIVQATNGNFYGTTEGGGTGGNCPDACGTIFRLSVGLGPFVKTLTTSGNVGAAVVILGNHLRGATSVTFNGAAATFTVVSSTEIKTTVPCGATTGKVKVVTPGRTLTSNVNFRVR